VILPGANIEATKRRAEQLRGRVEAMVVRYLEQDLPHVTVSVGIATFPEAGASPQSVLRAADMALYRAKAAGRNRVAVAEVQDDAPRLPFAADPPPSPAAIAAQ
jgi:diguanylate cyclase (GGDEF)-like protein